MLHLLLSQDPSSLPPKLDHRLDPVSQDILPFQILPTLSDADELAVIVNRAAKCEGGNRRGGEGSLEGGVVFDPVSGSAVDETGPVVGFDMGGGDDGWRR
jgi:hypothetical protein